MAAEETIYRACRGCGVTFGQPNDPGRKRLYHDDACKQRAYRERTGRTGHESRQRARQQRAREQWSAEQEAWANEQARRERERERSEERRRQAREERERRDQEQRQRDHDQWQRSWAGSRAQRPPRGAERLVTPEWTHARYSDDPKTAKRRATCHALYKRAVHAGTPQPEARECRKKAESLRVIYGL